MRLLVFVIIGAAAAAAVPLAPDAKIVIAAAGTVALAVAGLWCGRRVRSEVAYALFISFVLNLLVPHAYSMGDFAFFGGSFSSFSFIAWAVGLTALGHVFRNWQWENRWLIAVVLYFAGLFAVEYVGYYVLGIQLAGELPSYLGTGVIHGTTRLHIAYTLAGPLYLFVVDRFAWT